MKDNKEVYVVMRRQGQTSYPIKVFSNKEKALEFRDTFKDKLYIGIETVTLD